MNAAAKPEQIQVKAALDMIETTEISLEREMRIGRNSDLPAPPLKVQTDKVLGPRIAFKPHPDMICSDH